MNKNMKTIANTLPSEISDNKVEAAVAKAIANNFRNFIATSRL